MYMSMEMVWAVVILVVALSAWAMLATRAWANSRATRKAAVESRTEMITLLRAAQQETAARLDREQVIGLCKQAFANGAKAGMTQARSSGFSWRFTPDGVRFETRERLAGGRFLVHPRKWVFGEPTSVALRTRVVKATPPQRGGGELPPIDEEPPEWAV